MSLPLGGATDGWLGRLGQRVRTLSVIKGAGTMLLIAVFFGAYFWVLRHPLYPYYEMPLTALDEWLVPRPEAIVLYASLWAYVSLAPALLKDRRETLSFGFASAAISIVGLAIFVLWPTAVPAFEVDGRAHPTLAFLKQVDVAGNACPSLHVAFSVFAALWLERVLREVGAPLSVRAASAVWGLGIVYSTLAIRQHVVLDVLAGAALGAVAAACHFRYLNRATSAAEPAAPARAAASSRR